MEFNSQKPIFLQICDIITDKIMTGEWLSGERIPSVRDMGERMLVNPNTVQRAYSELQKLGIIEQQRGIGFFAAKDALNSAREVRRRQFIEDILPEFLQRMRLLDISWDDILKFQSTASNHQPPSTKTRG